MEPVSNLIPQVIPSPSTVGGVQEASRVQQRPTTEEQRPAVQEPDAYIPSEPEPASGRYWVEPDENGNPTIHFDDPERSEDPEAPARSDGDRAEQVTSNTDQVDREIERLKKRQSELEQQLQSETDESKRAVLEQQLVQVETELLQKDNDTYRRQHSTFIER